MSEAVDREPATLRSVPLGEVAPARSRHAGRRSAVALADGTVVVGTAAGTIFAYDRSSLDGCSSLDERWRASTSTNSTAVVALATVGDAVVAGERGPDGAVRSYDLQTGEQRWHYATADDVGTPKKETRFFLPFVADVRANDDRVYVAARRYERDGERRSFRSAIYAFEGNGTVAWRHETDASPISLAVDDDRVAVAYNRCPGDHQHGLVVLDAGTGDVRTLWDPGTEGQRRVGDVALLADGAIVASHGDYRGYRIEHNGGERWAVDLATPTEVDGETLYAYPNHVHATDEAVVFVTGNTYSTSDGRDTDGLHPDEHTAVGVTPDGERRWTADVGGFASELAAHGDRVAAPGAQHFRTRDADAHGVRILDATNGPVTDRRTDGVVTAVSVRDDAIAAVEEPVVYHDEGTEHGAYRLWLGRIT